jgi:EAL domain-containing protein (putative c-di-GMP-specific phosphodiesterase class I)
LLRWDSAALGRVSPEEFIAVAEATGEIRGVGQWLFKETVVTIKRWLADGKTFPKLSINLSSADFEDPQTAVKFKEFAQQSQVDPGLLEIELTERMLVKKSDTAIATVQEFRKNGFGVALDDFGAGQTSLQYLLHFPVQILKIDRSLTTGVVCDTRSTAVVRSIVDLAHQLGMRVIAEGVETAEQQAIIADTNCDAIQGYYFSKPLTERQFFEFLKHVRCEPLGGEPRH